MPWRSPELEAILGAALTPETLDATVLGRLVEESVAEGEQLDFKAMTYRANDKHPNDQKFELAKDVTAFANHRGGVILIGVREARGAACELKAIDTNPDQEQRWIVQTLGSRVTPAVKVDVFPISAGREQDGFYLAVVVPPSIDAPHAVAAASGDNRRPLHYPRRAGAETQWLSEAQVAEQYRNRGVRARATDQRTAEALAELQDAVDQSQTLWVYLLVVPEHIAHAAVDADFVEAVERWLLQPGRDQSPIQGHRRVTHAATQAAPGSAINVGHRSNPLRPERQVASGAYTRLYADGSAAAAWQVEQPEVLPDQQRRPPLRISDEELVADMIVLLDTCLQWATRQLGTLGGARLIAGLRGGGVDYRSRAIELHSAAGPSGLYPNSLPLPFPGAHAEGYTYLSTAATLIGRLSITWQITTLLLHHFRVAETRHLTREGRVNANFWSRNSRDVEPWAREHEVLG